MPRQESNRAKAARIAREKKRGQESDATQASQSVQPEATEEAEDQLLNGAGGQGKGAKGHDIGKEGLDIGNGGQVIDNGGQGTIANYTTVFKHEPSEEMLQQPATEESGRRRARLNRRNARNNDRQRKPMNKYKEDKLDREVAWMFFLNMRHENDGTKDTVIKAVEPTLDPMSYQYEGLWRTIMEKTNHLRGSTQGYLKTHVTSILQQDAKNEGGGRLAVMNKHTELAAYFSAIYSVPKFLEVFHFCSYIVDLSNQGPLALFYTKSLYANACARTKLHLDWLKQDAQYNEAVENKKRQDRSRKAAQAARDAARANHDDVAVGSDNLFGTPTGNRVPAGTRVAEGDFDGLFVNEETAATVAVDLTQHADDDADIVVPQFDKASTHNKDGFTAYLNNFPTAPQFSNVSRKEFSDKLAKKYKKPKTEAAHVEFDGDNLFLEGEAPPPSSR